MKKNSPVFATTVTGTLPDSALDIADEKKVDVLVQYLMSLRSNIVAWNDRAYRAAVWSTGILFSASGYCLFHRAEMTTSVRVMLAIGFALFGGLTQNFLYAARRSHRGTGRVIDRVQATLRLCDENAYIKGARFFGYSGHYIEPKSMTSLQILHGCALVFSVVTVLTA